MLTQCALSLHLSEQCKCSRPHGANDVSQYGRMANRRVALAEAVGDVNNNLNAGCRDDCGVLSSFVADGGQIERFVVVSTCGEHRVIAQSRCLRDWDGYTYIHTYIPYGRKFWREFILADCLNFCIWQNLLRRFNDIHSKMANPEEHS